MEEEVRSLNGKVCLVTGATRGIGQQTALRLAQMGARVVIVGRSSERIETTLATLRAVGGMEGAYGIRADLSSLAGVRQAAQEFQEQFDRLDVLVNNVGATLLRYQESVDGLEMTWVLNYLGHFLLTNLLLESLQKAAEAAGEARVIEITSSMLRLANPRFPRLQSAKRYNGVLAYAQSKLAVNMFTREMARRMAGSGITINTVTPGAVRTEIAGENGFLAGLAMRLINLISLPAEKGIRPILHLAVSPDVRGVSGAYYRQFKAMDIPKAWDDPENAAHLWQISQTMSGLNEDPTFSEDRRTYKVTNRY